VCTRRGSSYIIMGIGLPSSPFAPTFFSSVSPCSDTPFANAEKRPPNDLLVEVVKPGGSDCKVGRSTAERRSELQWQSEIRRRDLRGGREAY
jgi:hypothetical protein